MHVAAGREDTLQAIRHIARCRMRSSCASAGSGLRHISWRHSPSSRRRTGRGGMDVEVYNVLGAGDAFLAGFLRAICGASLTRSARDSVTPVAPWRSRACCARPSLRLSRAESLPRQRQHASSAARGLAAEPSALATTRRADCGACWCSRWIMSQLEQMRFASTPRSSASAGSNCWLWMPRRAWRPVERALGCCSMGLMCSRIAHARARTCGWRDPWSGQARGRWSLKALAASRRSCCSGPPS